MLQLQEKQAGRSWVLLALVFCIAAIGLYFVAGAFVTGVVGVGTLAGMFQKAAGA